MTSAISQPLYSGGATSLTLWSWNLCTEHLSWTGPQLRIFTYIVTFMLHNPSFRKVLSSQISDRKQGQREGKWLTKSHSSWMTVFSFHFHWGYCCYKLKMDSVPCSEKSLYSFWLDTWWKVYFSQDHFDCVKKMFIKGLLTSYSYLSLIPEPSHPPKK